MPADAVDALVIFGATGDLAKIETFPALVGLVDRGALTVPVVGITKQQMMRPYDRLIGAAVNGERYLFARQETVEAAWRVVQPVLGDVMPLQPYATGSWGPALGDSLLPDGETWHNPMA
jgi:glucose-6-phosphate 1-dehydrogenase